MKGGIELLNSALYLQHLILSLESEGKLIDGGIYLLIILMYKC
jgi:hypothetical protein